MNNIKDLVRPNRIGWEAIQHKDGWWVGTDKGVTCYGDHDLARYALTVIWQREGGRQVNYKIKPFTGADRLAGEHTPLKSAEEAMLDYEDPAGAKRRRLGEEET